MGFDWLIFFLNFNACDKSGFLFLVDKKSATSSEHQAMFSAFITQFYWALAKNRSSCLKIFGH